MGEPVVSALFLFNNRFEPVVPVLDELYRDRFSRRKFIMPFPTRRADNVIPVREAGWYFSGHLAQAADAFIEPEVTHYVVISDDLFVNPAIDERTILDRLKLGERSAWIKSMAGGDALRFCWDWPADAAYQLNRMRDADVMRDLPPAPEAQARLEAHGLDFPRPRPRNAKEWDFLLRDLRRRSKTIWFELLMVNRKPSLYPLVAGYADFLVLPAHAIHEFIRLCGIFAALNIFVELAIPTALGLAYDEIVTELELGENFRDPAAKRRVDAPLKGIELDAEGAHAFGEARGWSKGRLVSDFPADWLYVHPVKFSRWH